MEIIKVLCPKCHSENINYIPIPTLMQDGFLCKCMICHWLFPISLGVKLQRLRTPIIIDIEDSSV